MKGSVGNHILCGGVGDINRSVLCEVRRNEGHCGDAGSGGGMEVERCNLALRERIKSFVMSLQTGSTPSRSRD